MEALLDWVVLVMRTVGSPGVGLATALVQTIVLGMGLASRRDNDDHDHIDLSDRRDHDARVRA